MRVHALSRRFFAAAGILLFSFLYLSGCAGSAEVPLETAAPVIPVETPAEKAVFTLYLPIEDVTIAQFDVSEKPDGLKGNMLVMRFDRPGAWSILPERFLLNSSAGNRLVPVQTYGSSRLFRADMVLFRIAYERGPGVIFGPPTAEFFTEERSLLELPEAVAFISDKLLDRPLQITAPEGSRYSRFGISSLDDVAAIDGELMESLSPVAVEVIDILLDTGAAGGSRRGFRSVLCIPRPSLSLPAYPDGLEIEIALGPMDKHFNGDSVSISFFPAAGNTNPYPDVKIGDLGLFSGATPLLDPGLPEITSRLFTSRVLKKIGTPRNLLPSPVLWEGSFNAYRDERKRFLFYPGIFSYIPGQHPDLSSRDVAIVSGMEQEQLDGLLRGRSLITARPRIHGGIPSFFAAAPSPTGLEIAYQENPQLQDGLAAFLAEPAYFVWFD